MWGATVGIMMPLTSPHTGSSSMILCAELRLEHTLSPFQWQHGLFAHFQ